MARPDDSLDEAAVAEVLSSLSGWTLADDGRAIHRSFRFDSFASAFAFMAACAIEAEKLDHHPDWSNNYRTVDVTLTSHDIKGLSQRDFALAARMDFHAARGKDV
ncbi:4a-hydroxytetrahydrobiopterin dehydratase [Ahrensia sp. R2A130]|uniref:4a-hydroxytetrahydrobiopterin dehydratase n=1 Tax=Ahrensia sp. R2A130 TaxID=744979 RepID=UPI0001E08C4A|nr:4a-hydroxytetrahydrobiopterin dehydratase [Ahrensia sp. R2A130]EFL89560.1 putative pterin-4-alpha-carbinolamine dehydratase [Ahrensia sp. R2A130]